MTLRRKKNADLGCLPLNEKDHSQGKRKWKQIPNRKSKHTCRFHHRTLPTYFLVLHSACFTKMPENERKWKRMKEIQRKWEKMKENGAEASRRKSKIIERNWKKIARRWRKMSPRSWKKMEALGSWLEASFRRLKETWKLHELKMEETWEKMKENES